MIKNELFVWLVIGIFDNDIKVWVLRLKVIVDCVCCVVESYIDIVL